MDYLTRLVDAISQFFNVMLFNGDPNHSISGDAYRYQREPLRQALDWLFGWLETEHCKKAHSNDISKAARLLAEQRTQ